MSNVFHTGRVKWFNNRNGYGFITTQNKDIFVHHTSINTNEEQYKYLVEGEYVTFELKQVDHESYDNEAINVRGIDRGMLMCETRNTQRNNRKHNFNKQYRESKDNEM